MVLGDHIVGGRIRLMGYIKCVECAQIIDIMLIDDAH